MKHIIVKQLHERHLRSPYVVDGTTFPGTRVEVEGYLFDPAKLANPWAKPEELSECNFIIDPRHLAAIFAVRHLSTPLRKPGSPEPQPAETWSVELMLPSASFALYFDNRDTLLLFVRLTELQESLPSAMTGEGVGGLFAD